MTIKQTVVYSIENPTSEVFWIDQLQDVADYAELENMSEEYIEEKVVESQGSWAAPNGSLITKFVLDYTDPR